MTRQVLADGTFPWLRRHAALATAPQRPDRTLICLSHLRWNFVYQRPQHLMTRFAREARVWYFEEPVCDDTRTSPWLERRAEAGPVEVLVPHLPADLFMDADECAGAQRALLDGLLAEEAVLDFALWYYTPMSVPFSEHLHDGAGLVVYDAMDELSLFRGAPPELVEQEQRLLQRADVVFTGGYSLYEAKRRLHPNVHAFPSSVDVAHFARAREVLPEPHDQRLIAGPRLGFYGVLDERFDIALVDALARARPEWQLVLIGPVAKIDPECLPRHPNIHYLGPKPYAELPHYLSGWDVALLPMALNEATRFISPTKTPEYLAAGRPVVSTPIADVVRGYAKVRAVRFAQEPDDFIEAVEATLADGDRAALRLSADRALQGMSWDRTWSEMLRLMAWQGSDLEVRRVAS
ncbi:glycosyltransferase family 1 protein [Caldimonas brevitalea]|uniref:Glycosyl transferase n=1 Tax=Caldimonas brevitalea TaxID=413882 RepID=A0A0G3BDV9_9BURK|nr:glycosyltransferase family 1 protein [Caldimonas brevitalea]AKJ27477.1 glycosyl transferase [Caldimonas brevitalea]